MQARREKTKTRWFRSHCDGVNGPDSSAFRAWAESRTASLWEGSPSRAGGWFSGCPGMDQMDFHRSLRTSMEDWRARRDSIYGRASAFNCLRLCDRAYARDLGMRKPEQAHAGDYSTS
jgi:hypothetical protein